MFLLAVAWMGTVIFVARQLVRSRDGSVGLPIAFLFATTFLYCGAFTYAVPGYTHLRGGGDLYLRAYQFTEATVLSGTATSLLGIVGFAVGCLLPYRAAGQRRAPAAPARLTRTYRRQLMTTLALLALVGFVMNFFSIPVPLAQAAGQVLRNVSVAFVCLGAALAIWEDGKPYGKWLLLGALIPAAYLVIWGFTSYGFLVLTIFAGFGLTVLSKRRWSAVRLTVIGAGLSYVLLSLFVVWMSFREELRRVLWSDAGLGERLIAIYQAFSKTVLLSPIDFASLDLLNLRLSQNILVGKAVELQAEIPSLRQNGKSLLVALFAILPRFVWPDKPTMNDNAFLTQNTGVVFSDRAAFGSGPVFEYFVNFGHLGVFIGFILLGLALRSIDKAAANALKERRLVDFVRWFVVGLAFVAPLTSFFFMVNTALMSWIILTFLKLALEGRRHPSAARPA
jgi:hypothetical protein